MKRVLTILALLAFPVFAIDSSIAHLYEQAQTSYDEGEYRKALETYERILLADGGSVSTHFNTGNTAYKLHDFPSALLHFHRAQWLKPTDGDVRANLKQTANRLEVPLPTVPWYRTPTEILSTRQWQIACIALAWLLGGFGVLQTLLPAARSARVWVWPVGLLALCITLFACWASHPDRFADRGIVLARDSTAKFEPSAKSTDHFSLSTGAAVQTGRVQGDWVHVTLEGNQGWVKRADIGSVDWR